MKAKIQAPAPALRAACSRSQGKPNQSDKQRIETHEETLWIGRAEP